MGHKIQHSCIIIWRMPSWMCWFVVVFRFECFEVCLLFCFCVVVQNDFIIKPRWLQITWTSSELPLFRLSCNLKQMKRWLLRVRYLVIFSFFSVQKKDLWIYAKKSNFFCGNLFSRMSQDGFFCGHLILFCGLDAHVQL